MAKKLKKDDLEFDLDDISPVKTTDVAEEAIQKAVAFVSENDEPLTEEEEWQNCLIRLKAKAGHASICLPHVTEDGKVYLEVPTIENCTGEQFLAWMCLIYPPASTMGFTAKECDTASYRETLFSQILQSIRLLAFPKIKTTLNI